MWAVNFKKTTFQVSLRLMLATVFFSGIGFAIIARCDRTDVFSKNLERIQLRQAFQSFSSDLSNYQFFLGHKVESEDDGFAGVVKDVRIASMYFDYADELYAYLLADGKDPWGNEIVFQRELDDSWSIQSFGPNGIDDHGKFDDIKIVTETRESFFYRNSRF